VWSASPGKRLLKLPIAGADELPAAVPRRAVRWSAKYSPVFLYFAATAMTYHWVLRPGGPAGRPPGALLVMNTLAGLATLAVAGGFFAALSKGRQALHDLAAGTVVLRPGEAPEGFAPVVPVAPLAMPEGGGDGR
jgi:uncharacterized RDD family membrane protein YckC